MPKRLLDVVRDQTSFAKSVVDFYVIGFLPLLVPRQYWSFRYRRADPWRYETNDYEQQKYSRTLEILPAERFARVLEVGCSEGVFTQQLLTWGRAEHVLGVDVAEAAVARARQRLAGAPGVELRTVDILDGGSLGQFDLVFCAETLSHMGRYAVLEKMRDRLLSLMAPRARLVLVDSWPKARLLHHPFLRHADLELVREHVELHAERPYVIRLLQRRE